MRKEKVAGYVGLALFSLFPLLGAFQADESDAGWRRVASRTQRSVLGVSRSDSGSAGQSIGCAVVLTSAPLRAVVAGTPAAGLLSSTNGAAAVDWRSVYVDPQGQFTILEAGSGRRIAAPAPVNPTGLMAGVVPLDPATVGDLDPAGPPPGVVDAVLVSPPGFPAPLWVGELRFERSNDGRPLYAGGDLRALPGERPETSAADADSEPPMLAGRRLDPALRGAPFVTLEGVVLGLYVGDREGRPEVVPMALVREALAELDRRVSR